LILISTVASAQIVNIPDANFKARLLESSTENTIAYGMGGYIKIDANNDGNIQLAEAMAVDSLNIGSAEIANVTGLSGFGNLKKLYCPGNEIQTLDVSVTPGLKILNCSQNSISSLNLTGLVVLETLICDYNQLTGIDMSALGNLKKLDCSVNPLGTLNATSLINLEQLSCYYSGLTSLNVSGLNHLMSLNCADNQLTTLAVTTLTNLKELYCRVNSLTTLNLGGLNNLQFLFCEENLFTTLDLSGLGNLENVSCDRNDLASINLQNLPHLKNFHCEDNELTNLDFSTCPQLVSIMMNNNQIASLDLSNHEYLYAINAINGVLTSLNLSGCPSLYALYLNDNALTEINLSGCTGLYILNAFHNQLVTLDLSDCPALESANVWGNQLNAVFAKNGSNEFIDVSGNPNLVFICADESQIPALQQSLSSNGMFNTVVNSYCSFSPGGIYNTVTGTVRMDTDNNGCSAADENANYIRIGIAAPTPNGAAFTNATGNYTFFVQTNNVTLTPTFENPAYFNVTPASSAVNFPAIDGSVQTVDFCLSANGIHPDVEVILAPIDPARPGFDSHYEIIYRNKGNQTVSGQINFGFDDSRLDFEVASAAPDAITLGNLAFNYFDLVPFESRSISVTLNLNGPMEIPAVNINDVLDFSASITSSLTPDETPADNIAPLRQIVVGSFDPNDKYCLEGETVNPSQIGNYLHYIINFENTGTAAAENVVVKDMIDTAKFDLSSFQMESASHAVQVRINGNKVEFVFESINLGASEHGHVIFKIKTKNTLAVNAVVTNKADIFFDYNFPVATHTATTVFQLLGTQGFAADHSVNIYPNPAGNTVNIQSDSAIQSVQLFDGNGRILSASIDNAEKKIDISGYASGIYYLKVNTEKGTKTEKLIKK